MTHTILAKSPYTVKNIAIDAVMTALVLVMTMFVNIRLPFGGEGGLIHLGNVPLIVAALLFGRRTGMIAGGLGMALFDLISGWAAWASFTLVIVGAMGLVMGFISEKRPKVWAYVWAVILALFIKVAGYYLAEVVLYGNWVVPLASIPGNVIQVTVAAIAGVPLAIALKRALKIR